jgi:ribosome-associated protein
LLPSSSCRCSSSQSDTPKEKIINALTLAASAAYLADLRKGLDIQVYKVVDQLQVVDYFVLVTGLNRPHVKAIHHELHVRLKAVGETYKKAEGADACWWVLLDYGDVVVHILQEEARGFYDLDQLYGDCPQADWEKVELPELPEPKGSTGTVAAE